MQLEAIYPAHRAVSGVAIRPPRVPAPIPSGGVKRSGLRREGRGHRIEGLAEPKDLRAAHKAA
ncbi:hypothetical protein [Afifella sp. IM 167]|uniref:hypothetical protein n=1 Tax=Afifella sp. IM 167 TaxID=2033586 RepID=UPI001CCEA2B2|nr:hypothetical protein [Afifella sp. IM 167]MBZ8132491.1 hypothetical protein [Afifella sp. IM 167]